MDSRIILTTILSLSFGVYIVDLAMIFVKLTLEVFRSIVTLCSLDLLGIFLSQGNCTHNGVASEFVMAIMTTTFVFSVLAFHSFLRVWRKCFHFRAFKCPLFYDLTRVVTLATTIFLLGTLKNEFGSSIASKLFFNDDSHHHLYLFVGVGVSWPEERYKSIVAIFQNPANASLHTAMA